MVPSLLDFALFHAALGHHGGLFCNIDSWWGGGTKCQLEMAVIFLSTECGFHCGGSM